MTVVVLVYTVIMFCITTVSLSQWSRGESLKDFSGRPVEVSGLHRPMVCVWGGVWVCVCVWVCGWVDGSS